jgi:DNA-binding response OmpR family regulator
MANAPPPGPVDQRGTGSTPPSGDEARLSGARAEFVGSLPRRLDALRAALRAAEQLPLDAERANGLLRRVHAVGAAARVLGFASVAEALGEAEVAVRRATAAGRAASLDEVARALDLLPSLILGAPVSMRTPESRDRSPSHVWPISVLVYGAAALADTLATEDDDTRIERERTEDPARARELARIVGPDVVVIDADRPHARELVADLVKDPLVEPAPIVVVGTFDQPEAAASFVELGAARVLLKPCSPETLRRTVQELRDRASKPRPTRDPVGEVTVSALADRIAGEFRRGLVDALDGGAQATRVSLGEGHDVLAAVWGAVARVRELVTLHSEGSVRFQPTGPEGGVPLQPWSAEERRAGDRRSRETRSGEGVSLNGRRLVIADDDPAVVWFMAGLLKAVGAEVIEAHDGKQALDLVYSKLPDAVITDVLMPKLDGFSLCHEIKRDVAVRDVPVILLSWKEDLLQRLRELGADADGYLRKEAAASAVVERVREVLHSRARVEDRIRAGGEVRGRLDGMTPRLVLELACRAEGDLRVSIRDAAFLYEVQIRRGGMRSVTRSSPDGGFTRGEGVLPSLLGVSAGRFVVEPDTSPCRAELTGSLHEIIAGPITRARAALAQVAEKSLVRLERLELDHELVTAYLECTPEPAASLTRRLLAGERAKDLVVSGEIAPRLLEAVLSDIARRGGVIDAALGASASTPPRTDEPFPMASDLRGALPEEAPQPADETEQEYEPEPDSDSRPSIPMGAFAVDNDDVGWFSLAAEPSADPPAVELRAEARAGATPPPGATDGDAPFTASEPPLRVAGEAARLPLSDKATPGNWQAGPLFAFGDHGTLPGVGELPRVGELPPVPIPPPDLKPEPEPEPEAAGPTAESFESPALDFGTGPVVREEDDDQRATYPIPEPSPVPPPAPERAELLSPAPADSPELFSPIPEPSMPNERTAPTQPPARIAQKPKSAPEPAKAEDDKKDSVAVLFAKSLVTCVVAFFATTWVAPLLFGDPEQAPVSSNTEEAPPPPPPPVPVAPEPPSGFTLSVEPSNVPGDPTQGLLDIELSEEASIKVDGSFVGRYAKRRVLLPPGRHKVEVDGEQGSGVVEVELAAGRSMRLVSKIAAPAKSAAPSAE